MSFIGKLLCWLDIHKFGEPYPFDHEDNKYYRSLGFPGQEVLLAHCVRCGDGPFRLT